MRMDIQTARARIAAIKWYHEFDFGNGLVAHSTDNAPLHRSFWEFIRSRLDTIDFRGKTVLDIGCWDGYWSFYAERRGARRVLATDDCTQNWSSGEGVRLAKELLNSKIELDQRRSVYDLASLNQTFDVILFLGVYYHLQDTYYALSQIRHCCHPNTVVVIEGDGIEANLDERGQILDYPPPGHPAHGQIVFQPTGKTLAAMAESAYLTVDSAAWRPWPEPPAPPPEQPEPTVPYGWRWRMQTALAALRGRGKDVRRLAAQITHPISPEPLVNRICLICRPFIGANTHYRYRPPFGLDRYDTRFTTPAARAA
jgi:tRNA (mo5U34)-methyltransferase